MLPTAALDLLKFDTEDAETMAAQGKARAGYEILAEGLRRAVAARDAGFPWAEKLMGRYRETMKQYAVRYGLGDGDLRA